VISFNQADIPLSAHGAEHRLKSRVLSFFGSNFLVNGIAGKSFGVIPGGNSDSGTPPGMTIIEVLFGFGCALPSVFDLTGGMVDGALG
jgi:hypothetical protein